MARTHTALQREAEQALYRTLSDLSLNCLETLATNSEKAGFVRFLAMEYFPHEKDHHRRATSYLLNALVNMQSLSDLRLRMPRYEVQSWMKSLNKVLWSVYELGSFDLLKTNWRHSNVHFRLQTLCCDESLDLFQIIRSQTELQILGIYEYYDNEVGFLKTLKRLQNAQLHLPVIVTLESESSNFGSYFFIDRISIFPSFYSVDRHPTIHQVLAESFNENYTTRLADAVGVSALSIYLVDSCDMPSIYMLTKNLTMTFPKIVELTFWFENPCEIVSFLLTMIILEFT